MMLSVINPLLGHTSVGQMFDVLPATDCDFSLRAEIAQPFPKWSTAEVAPAVLLMFETPKLRAVKAGRFNLRVLAECRSHPAARRSRWAWSASPPRHLPLPCVLSRCRRMR